MTPKIDRYYFTFGQIHRTRQGEAMKDFWIEVEVPHSTLSWKVARDYFKEQFAIPEMQNGAWSMMYTESRFNSKEEDNNQLYPKGCYLTLIHPDAIPKAGLEA